VLGSTLANPLSATAARYNRDASVTAVAIYATLRSMSAVLSVLKDADVEGSVVVTSVTVSPGQTLEPLTQTLERFADIMFVVAMVSAALALLLGPASGLGGVLAGGALLAAALVLTRPGLVVPPAARRLWRALLTLGLTLAVVLPLAYSLAFWWGDRLTREAAVEATALLERVAPETTDAPPVDRSVLERAEAFLTVATDVFQATVDLSVAFLLKLVVLPAGLALAAWWLARATLAGLNPAHPAPP